MRIPSRPLFVLPLLFALPLPLLQDPQPPARTATATAAAPAEEPTLKGTMKAFNTRLKALRRLLEAPHAEHPPLPRIEELQQLALAAKTLHPSRLDEVPADQRAEFLLGFRKQMHVLLGQLFELEVAVLEQRMPAALELIAAMDDTKKAGHDRYKAKRDW